MLSPPRKRELLRLFLSEKDDPVPFYTALAHETIGRFPFALRGARVVDLGCGPGHYSAALREAGATVVAVDRDLDELADEGLVADARRLPLADGAVDGVFCSNMLEHARGTPSVIAELERVIRPGGWAWISWTNWYSPWGGHDISPFHYLGPRLGLATHRRLRGEPAKNVPGTGLFPVHIGRTLRLLARSPHLRVVNVHPRYYPSQRWIVRVPGVREVLTWNCVVVLRREDSVAR